MSPRTRPEHPAACNRTLWQAHRCPLHQAREYRCLRSPWQNAGAAPIDAPPQAHEHRDLQQLQRPFVQHHGSRRLQRHSYLSMHASLLSQLEFQLAAQVLLRIAERKRYWGRTWVASIEKLRFEASFSSRFGCPIGTGTEPLKQLAARCPLSWTGNGLSRSDGDKLLRCLP